MDLEKLEYDRYHSNTFRECKMSENHYPVRRIVFEQEAIDRELERYIDPQPFVPSDAPKREHRCEEIFHIQTSALAKRLSHIGSPTAVIGISGGLDSTLALLVTVKTFDLLGRDRKDIIGVTMPGFGTTDRTYSNAIELMKALHITILEIPIADAVQKHFDDIGHDIEIHDITYENSQARERTQILMDLSNKYRGIVVGTGDLSELALGWATYNGDHMSMYGVNVSIPKTLVRYLVEWVALNEESRTAQEILCDVLETPVSPELLPPSEDGTIAQKTEEVVGPYELHDFSSITCCVMDSLPVKFSHWPASPSMGFMTRKSSIAGLKSSIHGSSSNSSNGALCLTALKSVPSACRPVETFGCQAIPPAGPG